MRNRLPVVLAVLAGVGSLTFAQAPKRFNPMVELLAAKKPVFGLYAPSNRRFPGGGPGAPGGGAAGRGGQGAGAAMAAPAAPAEPPKSSAELAKMAVDYPASDFIFDGSMEGNFDSAFPVFSDLMQGMGS